MPVRQSTVSPRRNLLTRWGTCLYWVVVGLGGLASRLLFRLKVQGREHFPTQGGLLIVSNHLSHLDPSLLAAAFPRPVFYMAKRELFRIPLLASLLRTLRTIPVDRSHARDCLAQALQYLQGGAPVVIFPEGTRSSTGRLGRGLAGAVQLAVKAACPILPVAIIGSDHALGKGSHRLRPAPVRLCIGMPFSLGTASGVPLTRQQLQAATSTLMAHIEELLPTAMRPAPQEKEAWYG